MKNQLVKFIALCAIVCGFAVSAYAQNTPSMPTTPSMPGKMSDAQGVEARLSKMKSSLNLTDAQTAQVKTLLQAEVTARASGDKQKMKESHENMKTQMGKILTPDQLKKYQSMMSEKGKMPMNGSQPQK